MGVDIDALRRDFPLAALADSWPDDFRRELAEVIRVAIDGNDDGRLLYWSGQIREAADRWRAWCSRVRQAEKNLKEGADKRRKEDGDADGKD